MIRMHKYIERYLEYAGVEMEEMFDEIVIEDDDSKNPTKKKFVLNQKTMDKFEEMLKRDTIQYFEKIDEMEGCGGFKHKCSGWCNFTGNMFGTLFTVYRAYWRVLLPYRIEIRPFAVCCSGENYIEDLIKGP